MFVKICGLTSPDAIAAAVASGADAIGFVFAQSSRRIDVRTALTLSREVPDGVVRVAVMRHPSVREWTEVRDGFRPDWLQTDATDIPTLELGEHCVALPVFRDIEASAQRDWPAPLLFEGGQSGSGLTADWNKAASIAERTDLILAGGLSPDNVATAIDAVRPWGVDVSSGVESAPGQKDPDKIAAFIARARAAEKD